jgi:hypothetical protein
MGVGCADIGIAEAISGFGCWVEAGGRGRRKAKAKAKAKASANADPLRG